MPVELFEAAMARAVAEGMPIGALLCKLLAPILRRGR
jgi:hypothetical protein